MKTGRKALSMLLAIAMLCSLAIFSSAESQTAGIHTVGPDDLSGGFVQIVGQKTVVSYDSLTGTPTINVVFKLFMDDEHFAVQSFGSLMEWNTEYLTLQKTGYDLLVDGEEYDDYVPFNLSYRDSTLRNSGFVRIGFQGDIPTESTLDAENCAFELIFSFRPTAKFAELDPTNGTLVTLTLDNLSGEPDMMTYQSGQTKVQTLWSDVRNSKPAVVTYTASMVTYDLGDGDCEDLTLFAPKAVQAGTPFTLADGSDLKVAAEDNSGIPQVFDHWTDGTTKYASGATIPSMSADGLSLSAVYADDADGDGVADYKEIKVAYTLRGGDEGTLIAPSTKTDNGFFVTEGSNKVIFVEENEAIGDSIATVDVSAFEDWEFVGYFIDGDEYTEAELAALEITAETVIELRTMLDTNGNGIDDRTNVTIDFFAPDGTPIKSLEVPDGTPYTIYEDPAKENEASSGEAGENGDDPTEVTLPDVPATIPSGKHTGWEIEPVLDTDDKVIGIVAVPVYSEAQDVTIPNVITDPETDEEPEDIVTDMDTGSVIVHNDINGNPIMETEVGSSDEVQVIEHPTPGAPEYPTLPKRDEDGNPFVGWVLSGPEEGDEGEDVYTLDPYYAKPIEVTVTDPKSDETTDDDEILDGFDGKEIPADATYEILDENGDVKDSGKIADENGTITLPATEDMPARNNDGDVFTGEWIVTEEVDDEDGSTNFIFAPEYREPTEDDIDVIVDENGEVSANGIVILRGPYDSHVSETVYFYARIGNAPAMDLDEDRFAAFRVTSHGFENYDTMLGSASAVTYAGTEKIGDVTYGKFAVTFITNKSGIVKLTMNYNGVAPSDASGYYMVTVGDNDKSGKIATADTTEILRKLNVPGAVDAMEKGAAGGFVFELMDVDTDGKIATADTTEILRMLNEKSPMN